MQPRTERTYIGREDIERVDAREKVTGEATYVGDMSVPGMLIARVLRSELPHARIAELDVAPALGVPGVLGAVTSEHFVDHGNFGWPVKDAYILAYRKVRYVGDPIAAVAAETAEAAELALAAIDLALEPLPVVADARHALDPEAPMVPPAPAQPTTGEPGGGNLCERHIVRNGDPTDLLKAADLLLDEVYDFAPQEHAYLETEGALAIPEPDGGLTVYANNQSPFINRGNLAMVLGLPERLVRTIQPPVGGAFGGKDDPIYQCSAQAAKLALETGRPVKLILSRRESLATSYKRPATRIRLRISSDNEGELQAARAEVLTDSGAYASMTPMSSWRATMHAAGAYRYRAVHVDTTVVYTNNGYGGAFRGFGNVQATAAAEMAIDEIAARLGQDPIDFRLRNCLRQGDRTMTGDRIDHEVGLSACLSWVRTHSDWDRKRLGYASDPADARRRRGIGVAAYFHGSGLGAEGEDFAVSTLKIEDDHSVTMTSGLTDFGQGSRTVFTLVAAEILGIQPSRIRMLRPDTHTAVDSGPTVASRSSIVGGNATRVAAEKLRAQLTLAAADLLGCDPARLVRAGEAYVGPTEEPVAWETVVDHARAMGLQLSTEGRWQMPAIEWHFDQGTGEPYVCYVFGAQVAEVEVDRRTGRIRVLGLWAAHDAGKILYPQGALGQMYGGMAQGLGYALTEGFTYHDGVPEKLSLATYRIPRATDVPEIEGTFIETHLREGPFGAKNLAEPVMVGAAPAIANAVSHAIGHRIRSLPIAPDEVRSS